MYQFYPTCLIALLGNKHLHDILQVNSYLNYITITWSPVYHNILPYQGSPRALGGDSQDRAVTTTTTTGGWCLQEFSTKQAWQTHCGTGHISMLSLYKNKLNYYFYCWRLQSSEILWFDSIHQFGWCWNNDFGDFSVKVACMYLGNQKHTAFKTYHHRAAFSVNELSLWHWALCMSKSACSCVQES